MSHQKFITPTEARKKYGAVNLDKQVSRLYENNNVLIVELNSGEQFKMPALPQLQDFYFTFGTDRHRKYVKISAETMKDAVDNMIAAHGKGWANVYTAEEFAGRAELFGLTEL